MPSKLPASLTRIWPPALCAIAIAAIVLLFNALAAFDREKVFGDDEDRRASRDAIATAIEAYLQRLVVSTETLANAKWIREQVLKESALAAPVSADQVDRDWTSDKRTDFERRLLANDLSVFLHELTGNGDGAYREILIADEDGRLAGASNRTEDYKQDDDASWWPFHPSASPLLDRAACAKTPHSCTRIGDIEFDRSAGVSAFSIVTPLVSAAQGGSSRRVIGVVKAVVDTQALSALTRIAARTGRSSVHLVRPAEWTDPKGSKVPSVQDIFDNQFPTLTATKSQADPKPWPAPPESFAGGAETDGHGVSYRALASTYLGHHRWIVGVEEPTGLARASFGLGLLVQVGMAALFVVVLASGYWLGRRSGIAAVVLALLCAGAIDAAAQTPGTPRPLADARLVKVAVASWEPQARASQDEFVAFVRMQLARIQAIYPTPIRFEVHVGNYYQVYAWTRSGLVDAAVATPLVAALLDRSGETISSFEVTRNGRLGYYPTISAVTAEGAPSIDGWTAYKGYLKRLRDISRDAAGKINTETAQTQLRRLDEQYRVRFVSHLSSSGFLFPLQLTRDLLAELGVVQPGPKGERASLMKHVIDRSEFTVLHKASEAKRPPAGRIDIDFSYCEELDGDSGDFSCLDPSKRRSLHGDVDWRAYGLRRPDSQSAAGVVVDVRTVPNEAFVIRRAVADELNWPTTDAEIERILVNAPPTDQERLRPITTGYIAGALTKSTYRMLREYVEDLVSPPMLGDIARHWFDDGLYDFTLDETMAFLRLNHGDPAASRLSVVLSGGGVKSLYQAQLLGYLFGQGLTTAPGEPEDPKWTRSVEQLRTYDRALDRLRPEIARATPAAGPYSGPMIVHSMIGTSGGAILALFGATIGADAEKFAVKMERLARKRVFAFVDLPRVASLVALAFVLLTVLVIVRTWSRAYREHAIAEVRSAPVKVVFVAVALYCLCVLALRVVRGYDFETVLSIEGLFFTAAVVLLHSATTCASRVVSVATPAELALQSLSLVAFAAGVVLLLMPVLATTVFAPDESFARPAGASDLSVMVSLGTVVLAAAFWTYLSAGGMHVRLNGRAEYFRSFTVAALTFSLTYGGVLILEQLELSSSLELTKMFWSGLGVCGALSALLIIIWVWPRKTGLYQKGVRRFVQLGVLGLMRDRTAGLTTTLAATLVATGTLALGVWLAVIAPAVYRNHVAIGVIRDEVEEHDRDKEFRSNLIVTGALLSKSACPEEAEVGGLYMCFEGGSGCGQSATQNWRVFKRPGVPRAIDAVFASGSPFPVFPRHLAHTPEGCEVRLVDGGYAHNVPLDAARASGSRQVLILNASPTEVSIEAKEAWFGQLYAESPRLLSFMYARAQDLDRTAAGALLVAELSPLPDEQWPFLLDFRNVQIKRVINAAKADIQQRHRIGHILSWGRPQ